MPMGADTVGGEDESGTAPATAETIVRALADGGFDAEFFRKVVERVGVGVGVYDASGRFTYANQSFADMLARPVEEVVGTRVWEVNPALDGDRFEAYWDSFGVGETREHRSRHLTGDGETIHVETVTTAVEVDGSRHHVGTITDITPRVEQRRAAKRQDERLEEFASVVSHDLRNPLNVAMGRSELVDAECDSEHIDHVQRSLERMEALIDDVLTLAREGSRLTDPELVEVADAVQTAWYTSGTSEATLSAPEAIGIVESEESRLCQIFDNLFANAVEHAGPAVSIRVGTFEDGFFVEDNGPGIPPEQRENVFEHGYSETRDGTGFGLWIVKEISKTHDWTVELTESDDAGARFEFRGVEFVDPEERT
jgi:PAS domain S-box-containing protein